MLEAAALQYDSATVYSNLWHMDLVAAHYCENGLDAFTAFVGAVRSVYPNALPTLPG